MCQENGWSFWVGLCAGMLKDYRERLWPSFSNWHNQCRSWRDNRITSPPRFSCYKLVWKVPKDKQVQTSTRMHQLITQTYGMFINILSTWVECFSIKSGSVTCAASVKEEKLSLGRVWESTYDPEQDQPVSKVLKVFWRGNLWYRGDGNYTCWNSLIQLRDSLEGPSLHRGKPLLDAPGFLRPASRKWVQLGTNWVTFFLLPW